MRVSCEPINTSQVELKLTVVMTVQEWEYLEKQLPPEWPSWKFASYIHSILRKFTASISESFDVVDK